MFIFLSYCLSFCLFIFLSFCLSFCLFIFLSIFLSFCLFIFLSICLSFCLFIFLSDCLSFFLTVCLSFCLLIFLSVYLSFSLFIFLSDCLSFFLFAYFSVCLSFFCLFIFLSVCLSLFLPVYLSYLYINLGIVLSICIFLSFCICLYFILSFFLSAYLSTRYEFQEISWIVFENLLLADYLKFGFPLPVQRVCIYIHYIYTQVPRKPGFRSDSFKPNQSEPNLYSNIKFYTSLPSWKVPLQIIPQQVLPPPLPFLTCINFQIHLLPPFPLSSFPYNLSTSVHSFPLD